MHLIWHVPCFHPGMDCDNPARYYGWGSSNSYDLKQVAISVDRFIVCSRHAKLKFDYSF